MLSPQTFIKYVSLALLALSLQCKRHIYFILVHNCNTKLRMHPNTVYAHVVPCIWSAHMDNLLQKRISILSFEQLFHINTCAIKGVNIWYIHIHLSVHNLETTHLISAKHLTIRESNSPSSYWDLLRILKNKILPLFPKFLSPFG
jgi:hypothetical protein